MGFTVTVDTLPECDICGDTAHYDAKTTYGPWAYLCQGCFNMYGPERLGTGHGQRLIARHVREDR